MNKHPIDPWAEGLSTIPRPNWLEIDLDALCSNLRHLSTLSGIADLLLPVKADAYGHGSLACSMAVEKEKVASMLGTAHLFEGIALRDWGIQLPILVLGPALPEELPFFIDHQLLPTLESFETAQLYDQILQKRGIKAPFHLKINSGMNRYGLRWDQRDQLQRFGELQNAQLEGVYSHLACGEAEDGEMNQLQFKRFQEAVAQLPSRPRWIHLSNSAGLLRCATLGLNLARPGLASYGASPLDRKSVEELGLFPVMKMYATVRQIHTVPAGESVSYGLRWKAEQETRVAAVAIGYGDGFRRNPPAGTTLRINGVECPIVGTVCMDTTLIDVNGLELRVGDTVSIIDGCESANHSVEAMAAQHQTIPYEITCGIARRLYRVYRWQGRHWSWDQLRKEFSIKL